VHGPGAWAPFTPAHRGGSGPPLVLLHGFLESWRSWELVLPALERRHDALAVTLAGHAGGPPLGAGPAGADALADGVEQAMDEAGFATAHLAGNSLGGWVALELAARGRARSVTAFAPAGGWARGDDSWRELLAFQRELQRESRVAAPHAAALVATPEGRRRVTRDVVERYEHIPPELLAHRIEAAAGCTAADALIGTGLRTGWELDAERITAPVRVVWGTADRLLPWPSAAARHRHEWLPHADWVVLDDVGHAPQLDVPLEAAELILG
jgi:pimeloyl-ACP methyl ester carboxylesterase